MDLRALALLVVVACGEGAPPASKPVAADRRGAAVPARPRGDTLNNPFARDSAAASLGEKLFGSMNCDGCHGGGATGFAAPSLVDGRWRYGGADAQLFHSVFFGRPRGMPSYGGMLSETSIWQLVSYIRSQPPPTTVPTQAWR